MVWLQAPVVELQGIQDALDSVLMNATAPVPALAADLAALPSVQPVSSGTQAALSSAQASLAYINPLL